MAEINPRTSIIALSGPSSSGKTTLARLLQRVFSNQPGTKTFIIHEDDFYQPDNKIPSTTLPNGTSIQDWDCLEAMDIPFLVSALRYVHANGHLPPRLRSKEDLNDVSPNSGVGDELVEELRGVVSSRIKGVTGKEGEDVTLALLEGFLLYAPPEVEGGAGGQKQRHGLRDVHDQIDVAMFLPAPYDLVKERREKRSGYVTIGSAPEPELPQRSTATAAAGKDDEEEIDLEQEEEQQAQSFWEDPPGYVDDIVWPRYVRDHAWLLRPEEGTGLLDTIRDEVELIKKAGQGVNVRMDVGVSVAPGQGIAPMADMLKWAVEQVLQYLEQSTRL